MSREGILPSSFRDPSGFIYKKNNRLLRQINKSYTTEYSKLIESGLYDKLIKKNLIIPHQEISIDNAYNDQAYKIIEPELINFIAYPYEFCFSQLKDAALVTIKIQKIALEYGMTLKDASAYNIQFHQGRPLLIDSLSFDIYNEGQPWIAYRQFCQHFFAPLLLMSYKDVRLGQLLRVFIDGLPLDMVSKLLPRSTYFRFSILTHIHLHAKSQKKYESSSSKKISRKVSLQAMKGLIDNLESTINKLQWKHGSTEWGDYYDDTNYSRDALGYKLKLVDDYLSELKPSNVWDIGANTGLFSRVASKNNIPTVSFDIDPLAVEKNYLECKNKKETNILPLLLDLTNPSPPIGWENKERNSFAERSSGGTIMALALIHHLAISNNLPLNMIASFFSTICQNLIIEFVPKIDSQVQRLLSSREDIFENYDIENFENEFNKYFTIVKKDKVEQTVRTLYLMKKISR